MAANVLDAITVGESVGMSVNTMVSMTEITHKPVQKIKFDWLSDAAGAVGRTTVAFFTGVVDRVVFKPDSGGTQPSASYDIVLNDDDGNDVLWGVGANLSNAAAVHAHPWSSGLELYSAIVETKLTLAVTNAGNAKGGEVYVYVRGK